MYSISKGPHVARHGGHDGGLRLYKPNRKHEADSVHSESFAPRLEPLAVRERDDSFTTLIVRGHL